MTDYVGAYEQVVEKVYPDDIVIGVVQERDGQQRFYSPFWLPCVITKRQDNGRTAGLNGRLLENGESTSTAQPYGTRVLLLSATQRIRYDFDTTEEKA